MMRVPESARAPRFGLPAPPAGWLGPVLLCCALLEACGSHRAPVETFAEQCVSVEPGAETNVVVTAPVAGTLRIAVDERGLSVAAWMSGQGARTEPAASPVDRLGQTTLITERTVDAHSSVTVHIQHQDAADVTGEACLSAAILPPSAVQRIDAERAFAAAGRAVHARAWQTAFDLYLEAARRFDALGLRPSSSNARNALAQLAYRRLGRGRDSYALAAHALADGGERLDPAHASVLVGLRAKALMEMPDMAVEQVAPLVRRLLAQSRTLASAGPGGSRELPRIEIMEGFLDYRLDDVERARDRFTQAARRCRDTRDWECYGRASQNLALLAEADNAYTAALSAYADALRSLSPELEPELVADILNNMGRVQGTLGLFSRSEQSHTAAMRTYARLGHCDGVRRSLARSGSLLVQIGTLGDAVGYLRRAVSASCSELMAAVSVPGSSPGRFAASPLPTPTALRYPAGAYVDGQDESPCDRPIAAEALSTDGKSIMFHALASLAEAALMEDDLALAERCLLAAKPYAATSRTQMRLANAQGQVLLAQSDATAGEAFERALDIADRAELPANYEHRGVAHMGIARSSLLTRQSARTLQYAQQVLRTSAARGDVDQLVASLQLLAAAHLQSDRVNAAISTLEIAANLIERVPIADLDGERRATYLATQHAVFSDLTALLASKVRGTDGDAAWHAFEVSERGRSRSLRYAVNQSALDGSADLGPSASTDYQQLLRSIVREGHASTDGSELVDSLARMTRAETPAAPVVDTTTLLGRLSQLEAALVQYAVGGDALYAFVISEQRLHVVSLGDRHRIARVAGRLYQSLRNPETPESDIRERALELAELVLWPVSALVSESRVVFAPDDALHTVPFAVLPWSSTSDDELVLHRVQAAVVPSAAFLISSRPAKGERKATPRIELLGDPVYRVADWRRECLESSPVPASALASATRGISDWTESLPRLPGTRREVLEIAALARKSRPSGRVAAHLGCEAMPSVLRQLVAQSPSILHIATHGRVDARRPRLSALALTPESGADDSAFGLLDILELNATGSLVVLSACDTSRGRLLAGEGVLGPAQAFLQAGAAAVLASFWRIEDEATVVFMRDFYKHLLVDHLTAAQALRRAQLARASTGSVRDWAAFSLYGWPDTSI